MEVRAERRHVRRRRSRTHAPRGSRSAPRTGAPVARTRTCRRRTPSAAAFRRTNRRGRCGNSPSTAPSDHTRTRRATAAPRPPGSSTAADRGPQRAGSEGRRHIRRQCAPPPRRPRRSPDARALGVSARPGLGVAGGPRARAAAWSGDARGGPSLWLAWCLPLAEHGSVPLTPGRRRNTQIQTLAHHRPFDPRCRAVASRPRTSAGGSVTASPSAASTSPTAVNSP